MTGFFETYDVALLTLAAPVLAEGLGQSIGTFAVGVAIIRLASLASIPVLRMADRWGRRTLLFVSLGLFTIATGLTSLATGIVVFVALQMLARVFLATEAALANLVIAEEFRPHRRGAGISVLGVVSGIGFGAVGLLMLLIPLTTLGWRLFYLFALIPLGIVVYLRRNLQETRAFVVARTQHRLQESFWPRVGAVHRRTLLKTVALVSAFGFGQTSAFFYAADLAQNTYGWSDRFTWIVIAAGVFGVVGFLLGGPVSDRTGRRPIVAVAYILGAVGTVLIFTGQRSLFIPGFFLNVAAGACFVTVTLAYAAELFPTELRATLSSIVISCQVAAGSLGLALLGALSGVVDTSLAMLILGGALIAAIFLLRGLPETQGRNLITADDAPPETADLPHVVVPVREVLPQN